MLNFTDRGGGADSKITLQQREERKVQRHPMLGILGTCNRHVQGAPTKNVWELLVAQKPGKNASRLRRYRIQLHALPTRKHLSTNLVMVTVYTTSAIAGEVRGRASSCG